MGQFSIEIDVGPEWGRVIRELAHQAGAIEKALDDALTGTAREKSIPKVRENALELPAYSGEHTGVRARMAKGIGMRHPRRGWIRITTSMPEDEHGLIRGFDNPDTGWTHPVFGHEPRVRQFPGTADGFFKEPISEDEGLYEEAFDDVLENAAVIIAAMGI